MALMLLMYVIKHRQCIENDRNIYNIFNEVKLISHYKTQILKSTPKFRKKQLSDSVAIYVTRYFGFWNKRHSLISHDNCYILTKSGKPAAIKTWSKVIMLCLDT